MGSAGLVEACEGRGGEGSSSRPPRDVTLTMLLTAANPYISAKSVKHFNIPSRVAVVPYRHRDCH